MISYFLTMYFLMLIGLIITSFLCFYFRGELLKANKRINKLEKLKNFR